jgi:arsenate reductase (thioredoxin)
MKILFLCVANSARSQMAEGLARVILPKGTLVQSAGSQPSTVNPFAIRAMREIQVDIAGQRSKSVDTIAPQSVDIVVTLCAEEVCPIYPGHVRKIHWPLPDPAQVGGDDEEVAENFRNVREMIRSRLVQLAASEKSPM